MKSRQTNGTVLAAMIGSVLIISTGCQSGMFTKPDLNRLAFWKKENLQLASRTQEIPPPSSHFDPDTKELDGDTKEQIEASITRLAQDAKRDAAGQSGLIRKPYSLDTVNPKIAGNSPVSDQPAASGTNEPDLSRKLNQLQTASNDAMRTADNAVKQTGAQIEDSARTLADLKKKLQADSDQAFNEASKSLQDNAGQVVDSTTEAVNQFSSSTANTVNQTVSNVKQSFDNTFQPPASPSSSSHVSNPYAATTAEPAERIRKSVWQFSARTHVGPDARESFLGKCICQFTHDGQRTTKQLQFLFRKRWLVAARRNVDGSGKRKYAHGVPQNPLRRYSTCQRR